MKWPLAFTFGLHTVVYIVTNRQHQHVEIHHFISTYLTRLCPHVGLMVSGCFHGRQIIHWLGRFSPFFEEFLVAWEQHCFKRSSFGVSIVLGGTAELRSYLQGYLVAGTLFLSVCVCVWWSLCTLFFGT